ncbi:MAG: hypothetical protein OEZ03_15925, partial [Alphaproteobacteria bacterium]|nr:hypothetical protein [Alphaproteobacteria bacterium]
TVAEAAELPSETGIGNTAVRHEESLSENEPWQLVNASNGGMSPHDFGGMAAQYMGVDLAGGKILLAAMTDDPRAHVTWWRIDPRTGATLGMTDRGTGGVSAEQTSLLLNVGQAGMCFAALGKSMGDRNRTGSDLVRFGVFLLCGSGTVVSAYYAAMAGAAGTVAAATAATNLSNIGTAVAMIGAIVELSML